MPDYSPRILCFRKRVQLVSDAIDLSLLKTKQQSQNSEQVLAENMDAVTFSVMRDLQYANDLVGMMCSLYQEDQAEHPPNVLLFPETVEHLVRNPSAGQIVLFQETEVLAGYAILIPHWSNEFGGVLLFIDELFVKPKHRNRGIAHRFFHYLEEVPPFGAVAFALEVSSSNPNASRLYESLGFVRRGNATLTRSSRFPSTANIGVFVSERALAER